MTHDDDIDDVWTQVPGGPTREWVLRKAADVFPDERERREALRLLDGYGREPHEREVHRVHLAILKLCEGSRAGLERWLHAAKADFRDALVRAEYPHEAASTFHHLDQDAYHRARAEDRLRYLDWLQGAGATGPGV